MNSDEWDDGMELIASLLRKRSVPKGTYLAGSYSLVSKWTSHLCFINPPNKVAGFRTGDVVATACQFDPTPHVATWMFNPIRQAYQLSRDQLRLLNPRTSARNANKINPSKLSPRRS